MMKKCLLIVFCGFIMSFSFAQDRSEKLPHVKTTYSQENSYNKDEIKRNSIKAVEYLESVLKLDAKQKVIFMNVFSEYANNIAKARIKMSKSEKIKDARKELNRYMLRFSEKRDNIAKECLNKRQVNKYSEVITNLHPFTLEVRLRDK